MVELRCMYEGYMDGSFHIKKGVGEDLKSALLNLCDKMCLYVKSDYVEEEEEEDNKVVSFEELISEIECQNGDGCDYIFRLENVNSGEVYIEEMVEEED